MMDESPITKLVQRATAAHAAVNAQREQARQTSEAARDSESAPIQTQGPGPYGE